MQTQARVAVPREWRTAIDRLATVDDSSWQLATRCRGWTLRDLVAHAVWGVSMEADALRRARTQQAGRADGEQLAADVAPAEALSSLRTAVENLAAELDRLGEADLQRLAPMPYGDVPVAAVLNVFVMEAGVHTSDILAALGTRADLPRDVVTATEAVLAAFMPTLAEGSDSPPRDGSSFVLAGTSVRLYGRWDAGQLVMGADGSNPDVTVSGNDTTVLLFALGRLDVDDVQVSGDIELARRFKAYVPGP